MNGADHIVELAAECAPHDGKNDRAEKCADEALDCLLWRELDEWCTTHSDTTEVREAVVADDEARRYKEPDETFENIVYDEVAENQMSDGQLMTYVRRFLPRDDDE
jgi:hypothetical protein